MTNRKQYGFNGLAGCVQQRRNRQTGTLVGVYHNEQAGLDSDGGEYPWSTVCEEHGTIVSHRTLSTARRHAPDPLGWCGGCHQRHFSRSGADTPKNAPPMAHTHPENQADLRYCPACKWVRWNEAKREMGKV